MVVLLCMFVYSVRFVYVCLGLPMFVCVCICRLVFAYG